MKRLIFVLPVLAGAIAGAIVALAIGAGHSTKTVTDVAAASPAARQSTSASTAAPNTVTAGSSSTAPSGSVGLSVNQIYKQDAPGVVDITVASIQSTSSSGAGNSGAGGLFGLGGGSQEEEQEDEGAGVVYNTKGDILTDEHVVAGVDPKIEVHFQNGVNAAATIVSKPDPSTDVAVIHVNEPSSELHPITFADSSTAQVGDSVVAIGSPFSQPETVTAGIVSAVGRTITAPNGYPINGAIQTDAAINPGNSGGPLLNAEGEALGLNDQILTNSDDSDGIGFATPGNTDVQVANEMIAGRTVEHAYVGVCITDATTGAGAEIVPDDELAAGTDDTCENSTSSVAAGSPAAAAGLKGGDVITAIDGAAVSSEDSFVEMISKYAPGDTVTFTVKVGGSNRTRQFKVKLTNRPASAQSTAKGG